MRHPLMHNPATAACTLGHHARLGMGLRTRSMLGPSSVARLRRSHAEFRQNRRETDATKLQKMLSEASTAAMWKPAARRLRPTRPPAPPPPPGHTQGGLKPRSASVSLGQFADTFWLAISVMFPPPRHWAADDADSGRLEGLVRDWQHEWRIVGNQASCRRLMRSVSCMRGIVLRGGLNRTRIRARAT